MSVKKNITVATLAALLAVPAFGATNASHALHMPSVTAHADSSSEWNNLNNEITQHGGHNVRRSDEVDPGIGTTYNGNNIQLYMNGAYVNGQKVPMAQAINLFDYTTGDATHNTNTGTSGTSTQYSSSNNLPQTGENDGASKAMAMGAVTLGASASLMALSVAKKHKQDLETVTPVEPAVNSNDGKDNTKSNADKSMYDMIMGNTFTSISNGLKQM